MKAVILNNYGDINVLEVSTAAMPSINDHEVLVKVKAAGINPVDAKIRSGKVLNGAHALPLILGWDVSGVITEVGKSVTNFKVGDAVYSRPDIFKNGAYAEYIAIKATEVALKPQSLTFNQAAAVPLAALTAYMALFDSLKLQKGQRVLIHAGAGGVGIFALQLAKNAGAYVITTTSTKNIDFVKSLGADEVIDYTTTDFADHINASQKVDAVFDTLGGDTQAKSWGCLKQGGNMVSIVSEPDQTLAAQHGGKGEFVFVEPNSERLTELAKAIDAKKLHVEVAKVFLITEVHAAHTMIESGRTRGKIVLEVEGN